VTPRHFLDLDGAATVVTEPLRLTHRVVADLLGTCAMGVVHGEAGLGKTFAVEHAVVSGTAAPQACWTSFPARPTMRQVTVDLLGLLTRAHVAGTRFQATHELVEVLAQRPRLLVIDEAQRLNRECIELLRHLHDHPATRFGLLLVGGDGCWEVLSREPMLRSRIYRRLRFQPLTPQQVQAVLPGYHPLYAQAAPDVIGLVDDYFGHGNWRNWAAFTHTAVGLAAETGRTRLDEALARNVFALHGGGADRR
jgi:AAA domain